MIDIEKIKELAPPNAAGLFNHGDGKVSYYEAGDNLEADLIGESFYLGKEFPEEKRWLAIKNKIGEWIICRTKNSEAFKTLSKLNYVWIPKALKWIKKEGI